MFNLLYSSDATELGIHIKMLDKTKEEILQVVRKTNCDRYQLVIQKLAENNIRIDDLSLDALLDRLLGVDFLFEFKGLTFAVDVTVGKGVALANKVKKIQSLRYAYRLLSIDHVLVVRLRSEINDDIFLDFFSTVENIASNSDGAFYTVIKYTP